MKTATVQPSKSEVISWINDIISIQHGKLEKIQELGSCTALLHIATKVKPANIKIDKYYSRPIYVHEISTNIKAFMKFLENMNIQHKFDIQKLANMKYQECLNLGTFMYLKFHNAPINPQRSQRNEASLEKQRASENGQKQPRRKFKITAPLYPKPPVLEMEIQKEEPPIQTISDMIRTPLQVPKTYEDFRAIFQETRFSETEKLSQIAKILNLTYTPSQLEPNAPMSGRLSLEESYKRSLRPSLTSKSKFLGGKSEIMMENMKPAGRITEKEDQHKFEKEQQNTLNRGNIDIFGCFKAQEEENLLKSGGNAKNRFENLLMRQSFNRQPVIQSYVPNDQEEPQNN